MPYLATKLRNRLVALDPSLNVQLKNIKVNGDTRGCSGFISKEDRIVYVNTEESVYSPFRGKSLYRVARHMKDYSGCRNHHVENGRLAEAIIDLLNDPRFDRLRLETI